MPKSKNLLKAISLAKQVRKKIEKLCEIERGHPDLAGYCGIASSYFVKQCKNENIDVLIVSGNFRNYSRIIDKYYFISGHAWAEYEDYIIDITATQFRQKIVSRIERNFNKKVYVSKISNPHYEKIKAGSLADDTIKTWYVEPIEEIFSKIDETIKKV